MKASELAINGGSKAIEGILPSVRDKSGRTLGKEELAQLQEVIDTGSLSLLYGQKTKTLEKRFAELYGVDQAIAVSSGTAALHTAIIYLNPEPGDEIILSPITDAGTVIPILSQLAIPVFADVDPQTQNIDPKSIEANITPRTKAIMVTHVYGNPADMDPILEIARRHNLLVIEDCAQAFLAYYKGKLCGTLGDIGCFSFQQSKHMTTGDGGIVVARSDEQYGRKLRLCADKGWPRDKPGRDHLFLAPNYHMTELQAAVGLAQLEKLEGMVRGRVQAADQLTEILAPLDIELVLPSPGTIGTYFLYSFRLSPERLTAPVAEVMRALAAEGIDGFVGYPGPKPLYRYPFIQDRTTFGTSGWPFTIPGVSRNWNYEEVVCPIAEVACVETICMWWTESFSPTHIEQIGAAITKVLTAYRK